MAEINDGLITPEYADYLRQKVFMEEQKCMSSLIDFTNGKRVYNFKNFAFIRHFTVNNLFVDSFLFS